MKWVGAAYLVWLGVKLWRAPVAGGPVAADAPAAVEPRRMVGHAFIVTALNPKSITFFVRLPCPSSSIQPGRCGPRWR